MGKWGRPLAGCTGKYISRGLASGEHRGLVNGVQAPSTLDEARDERAPGSVSGVVALIAALERFPFSLLPNM